MTHQRAIRVLLVALAIFAGFAIANIRRSRVESQQRQCLLQLGALEGAKEQFALDHDGTAPESFAVLIPQYLPAMPRCPAGGDYALGDLQTLASCSRPGHEIPPE
jgi:hypothetical protein